MDIPEKFGIDFNIGGVERELANTIKARYDAGVSNFKQDGTAVAIPIKEATKKGYAMAQEGDSINLTIPDSQTRRGRVGGGGGTNTRHSMQSGNNSDNKGEYP